MSSDATHQTLSVLVPTYNNAQFIAEAIESVLAQGVQGMEIIVADDGSTDDTQDILKSWVQSGAIRYFRQPNAGPAAARNMALEKARGRYLMLLDADDLLYPGCIPESVAFLDRHPEVGFFFTNYDLFDENGVVNASGVDIWKIFRTIPHREVGAGEWTFSESLAPWIIQYGGFMHTSGVTLRREVVSQAGPFLTGYFYGEDDEFYARATYHCTAGYLDRVLSRKRNHAGSIIHDRSKALRNARNMLELREIQRRDYWDDPRIQTILRKKIRSSAASYVWGLIQDGQSGEARRVLRRYLQRYPLSGSLYKLFLSSFLRRGVRRTRAS